MMIGDRSQSRHIYFTIANMTSLYDLSLVQELLSVEGVGSRGGGRVPREKHE